MPSAWYAKDDRSIDALHQALADDMCKLFDEGILVQAPCHNGHPNRYWSYSFWVASRQQPTATKVEPGKTMRFWAAWAGAKGDWPWVRKAFHLKAGFQSGRKCHLCPSVDSWIITKS